MKRFVMALAMAAILGGAVGARVAQADGKGMCPMCSSHMDPGKKADKMALLLDLNDKQKDEVKRLAEAKHKRLQPHMEKMESEAKAAGDDFEAGVKKVLSVKQIKKLDAWKEAMENEGKDCR